MSFLSRLFGASDDTVSPEAFAARTDRDAPIIDVRTPQEYADGHLAGARNVDVMAPDFRRRIASMNLPENEPIYLYCRSGSRSGKATSILREMGHAGAVNAGGLSALARAGASMDG